MREHAVLVPAVDEVHAAVPLVHVLERQPARDAAIVEVPTPVALVLVPVGRRPFARGLREELVVPELDLAPDQGRGEAQHPGAKARLPDLAPDQRRAALHDLEAARGAVDALLPGPVEGELLLVVENGLAAAGELLEVTRLDRCLDHEPAALAIEVPLCVAAIRIRQWRRLLPPRF